MIKQLHNLTSVGLLTLLCLASLTHVLAGEAPFLLRQTTLALKQVDLTPCLSHDELGYPRLDPAKLDLSRVIERQHTALILETEWLRLTLLPEMGRVYSMVSKATGHEQLWTNTIARPILGQHNDTGWWMVWGGIEYTLPRGEHGTTWALPWAWTVSEDSPRRKTVRMTVVEPKTRLEENLEISVLPNSIAFEAAIRIRNTSSSPVRFSHWTNPMLAPGGKGELTPKTEFIVPCDSMIVADKNFNSWMLGNRIQDFKSNPLRFAENWQTIGDLLVNNFTAGFYGAFSHESNEGVVRVFDPAINPGMDIWTWGFPPPPERQKDYSLGPNLGYVEMWGGTARNFSDDALSTLPPGNEIAWIEWMYPFHGTEGLTHANQHLAVRFIHDQVNRKIQLAAVPSTTIENAEFILHHQGRELLHSRLSLNPGAVFTQTLSSITEDRSQQSPPQLEIKRSGKTILTAAAETPAQLEWGGQYLPKPPSNAKP